MPERTPAERHRYTRRTALRDARRRLLSPESTEDEKALARAELVAYLHGNSVTLTFEAARAIFAEPLPPE